MTLEGGEVCGAMDLSEYPILENGGSPSVDSYASIGRGEVESFLRRLSYEQTVPCRT